MKYFQNVSRIGFGGFRFKDTLEHRNILKFALKNGINLIDSASHFQNGSSELAIGKVVKELGAELRKVFDFSRKQCSDPF